MRCGSQSVGMRAQRSRGLNHRLRDTTREKEKRLSLSYSPFQVAQIVRQFESAERKRQVEWAVERWLFTDSVRPIRFMVFWIKGLAMGGKYHCATRMFSIQRREVLFKMCKNLSGSFAVCEIKRVRTPPLNEAVAAAREIRSQKEVEDTKTC